MMMFFSAVLEQCGKRWLGLFVVVVLLVLTQFWFGSQVKDRTHKLQVSLETTHDEVLELTQVLGYGGLIHHFKNFLLRPDETAYLEVARASSARAVQLIALLESNAEKLGIAATLGETRSMVDGYSRRLEMILPMVASGLSVSEIDDALRLDDQFAITEITVLSDRLLLASEEALSSIDSQGKVLSILSVAGTILLAALIVVLSVQRRYRVIHLESVAALNEQLKQSNQGLSDANTSLKQFAGIVSHDLKSPLRHIGLFSDQILEEVDNPSAVRNSVEMIQRAVGRMNELIVSLLDFTQTGFQQPKLVSLDIAELSNEVVGEFEAAIQEQGITVTVHAEGEVLGDAQLLRRVFYNLLDNSFKYKSVDREPVVSIVAMPLGGEQAGMVQVCISDNGIGIPAEHVKRVFEPMQRLHGNQSQYSGTGIGLSLAKTVVNAHGGEIDVVENFCEGTRICFTLKRDV